MASGITSAKIPTFLTGGSQYGTNVTPAIQQSDSFELAKHVIARQRDTIANCGEVIDQQILATREARMTASKLAGGLSAHVKVYKEQIVPLMNQLDTTLGMMSQRLDKLLTQKPKKNKSSSTKHSSHKSSGKKEKTISSSENLLTQLKSLLKRFFRIFFS